MSPMRKWKRNSKVQYDHQHWLALFSGYRKLDSFQIQILTVHRRKKLTASSRCLVLNHKPWVKFTHCSFTEPLDVLIVSWLAKRKSLTIIRNKTWFPKHFEDHQNGIQRSSKTWRKQRLKTHLKTAFPVRLLSPKTTVVRAARFFFALHGVIN